MNLMAAAKASAVLGSAAQQEELSCDVLYDASLLGLWLVTVIININWMHKYTCVCEHLIVLF